MGSPANATYPGIAQILSVTVRQSHGTTPDGFQLVITPQPSNTIIEQGTLRLEYNDQYLDFPECRVDLASFNFDDAGQLIDLTILDRKWKWQIARFQDGRYFGLINGEYNIRREDGTIRQRDATPALAVINSERTPQQLATLCLQAAGENIAPDAVNALPNDMRPYVAWDGANPMDELNNLAELLGCRVVKGLDNVTRVRKVNQGNPLPEEGLMRYGASADYFDTPDAVGVESGPVRFQHDFELEAVGLDVDGSVKLIDELSYAPAGGWSNVDIFNMTTQQTNAESNAAEKSLFFWYRIKLPLTLPIFGEVKHREQLILLGSQVFQENIEGIKRTKDAIIYGVWYTKADATPGNSVEAMAYLPDASANATPDEDDLAAMVVPYSFGIDPETGIVKFSNRVWKSGENAEGTEVWQAATLRLRTTCHVRFADTGEIVRYRKYRQIANTPTPTVVHLRHDEIQRSVYAIYNNNFQIVSVHENSLETDPEIEHYLSEAVIRYAAPKIPQTGVYTGWRFDIDLDGAIQSITWSTSSQGGEGPITVVERNHDTGGDRGIPYRLKREHQRTANARRRIAQAEWREKQIKELARAAGVQK